MAFVQPWSQGPNYISLGLQGGALQFFGTAAYVPKPRIVRAYKALPNDVMAHQLPYDRSFQGEYAVVSMSMSRWDNALYALMAQPTLSGTPGTLGFGSLGTLMVFEGYAMKLGIQFPYQAISAFSGMPQGYIFHAAMMESDDISEEGGTEGQVLGLTFYCQSVYNVTTRGSSLYTTAGSFPAGY